MFSEAVDKKLHLLTRVLLRTIASWKPAPVLAQFADRVTHRQYSKFPWHLIDEAMSMRLQPSGEKTYSFTSLSEVTSLALNLA